MKFYKLSVCKVGFVFGVRFRKYVIPEGLANEPPKMIKNLPNVWILLVYNGFNRFHMQVRCNKTIKHVPDPFGSLFDHNQGTYCNYMFIAEVICCTWVYQTPLSTFRLPAER